MKKLFVKSKTCLNLNYVIAKRKPKRVGFIKKCDKYRHKFNYGHFQLFIKIAPEDLNPKFRSKFNHGFAYRGYLHYTILKA